MPDIEDDPDLAKVAFQGEIKHRDGYGYCPILLHAHLSAGARPLAADRTRCLGPECRWYGDWPGVTGCVIEAFALAYANNLRLGQERT